MTDAPLEKKDPLTARERVIDQKSEVTGRISDTCRIIGFGLLIFYFTVHFNDTDAAKGLRAHNYIALYAVGSLGILTIFFDYLQYVFGSIAAKAALRDPNHYYDDKSFAYKARNLTFISKQVTAGIGALVLIYVMAFPTVWGVVIGAFCRAFWPVA